MSEANKSTDERASHTPTIERYRVDFGYGRYFFEKNPEGDWVKFADAAAEIEAWKIRGDGHAETLRGIARMDPATEAERMRQWARDGLSGYTESTESTVKRLTDQVAEACDFLRRGAALVAMAGDQNMALSMHRNADRIQYMGQIQPKSEEGVAA
jgi:hypothetical protein